MEPDEILPALTGELYRYRLAIQDQLRRITTATDELRQVGERSEKDQYKLVFAPSMSIEAFTAQLHAIHDRDISFVWRLKSEAEFMLAAVYVLAAPDAFRPLMAGWNESCGGGVPSSISPPDWLL